MSPLWSIWYIPTVLHALRCGFERACKGARSGIFMTFVKREERARWMNLDSIVGLGWAGTAIVGGFLIDEYGFKMCLIIVCIGQYIASGFTLIANPFEWSKTKANQLLENNSENDYQTMKVS